jgi:hypothetical protein
MTTFFLDLYSMTHEFYRTRNRGAEKALAEGLCVVTCMCAFMNVVNFFELIAGSRIPLPLENRMRIIVFGLSFYVLGMVCVKCFIKQHPLLQSSEQMREHSERLPRSRKVALLSIVVGNLALLIALAQFLRK